jgi:hypothetical protein
MPGGSPAAARVFPAPRLREQKGKEKFLGINQKDEVSGRKTLKIIEKMISKNCFFAGL